MVSTFSQALLELEKNCFVQLASAAKNAGQIQMALNAIIRAQHLESSASFAVSQEFAKVLWAQGERKLATEYLKEVVTRNGLDGNIGEVAMDVLQNAMNVALLVSSDIHGCIIRIDILDRENGSLKPAWKSQTISALDTSCRRSVSLSFYKTDTQNSAIGVISMQGEQRYSTSMRFLRRSSIMPYLTRQISSALKFTLNGSDKS
jgi:hypothetical protein